MFDILLIQRSHSESDPHRGKFGRELDRRMILSGREYTDQMLMRRVT